MLVDNSISSLAPQQDVCKLRRWPKVYLPPVAAGAKHTFEFANLSIFMAVAAVVVAIRSAAATAAYLQRHVTGQITSP